MKRFPILLVIVLLLSVLTSCGTNNESKQGSEMDGKQSSNDDGKQSSNDDGKQSSKDDSVTTFVEGNDVQQTDKPMLDLYPVINSLDKWGYIDSQGRLLIDYQYDHAYFFSDGAATVSIDGKEGMIGTDGSFLIEPLYDFCGNFSEGWAHVIKEEGDESKHGFANLNGDVFYHDDFNNNTESFHEGLAVFEKDGKFGYVDTTGRIVIEPQYAFAHSFSEGLAMVVNDDFKAGFINKLGEIEIPFYYDYDPIDAYIYQGFHDGLAGICEDGKYGFIDRYGDCVIEPIFDYVNSFSDGLALVYENGLYGFISEEGEYIIEPQFSHASAFQEGYAYAKLPSEDNSGSESYDFDHSGYGFIDKSGKFITDTNLMYEDGGGYTFIVEWATGFHNELARVALQKEDGTSLAYINDQGEIVWEMEY